jgi:N-acetylneuraminate synthase
MKANEIFYELFVLELANNHWGSVERGIKIIDQFSQVVRFNNMKAAIKLQFRDVDHFIHKDFKKREDIRYIKKTLATKLSWENYGVLVKKIKESGCIPLATPFDEHSVDMCVKFDMPIIKIASSDLNDWILIEKIASTKKPCIVSTGGSSLKDLDDLVTFFKRRNIPLAINHCVSIYPSEDYELEISQVDFLKNRYPDNVIGFSTHEHTSWDLSIAIAYAKGARTFERHIDISEAPHEVTPYCSLPGNIDEWFRAFKKAKEMCGRSEKNRRIVSDKERKYLEHLVRGVYAKKDLKAGHQLTDDDIYLAIPLQIGQISCREYMRGEVLVNDLKADQSIGIDDIDSPYAKIESLRKTIFSRGVE